jgi:uncharacterized protein (TIGR02996 family)
MNTLDQLLDDLAAAPEDWKLRGVVADWCEDNGRAEDAACLRWMVRHHKRPYHGSTKVATWFNADTIRSGLGDHESDIPGALYQQLEGGKEVASHKCFGTVRAAEESMLAAWSRARAKGWKVGE